MTITRTLHNITMTSEQEIAPGLFLARDTDGMLRAHNGDKFRGYVGEWGAKRFRVCWWSREESRFLNMQRHKTRAGAERTFRRLLLRDTAAK